MASYINSKIQGSISFVLVTVIPFLVCSGFAFFNPDPTHAFKQADVDKVDSGSKQLQKANLSGANLRGANLRGAIADKNTKFPEGFDPTKAGVIMR